MGNCFGNSHDETVISSDSQFPLIAEDSDSLRDTLHNKKKKKNKLTVNAKQIPLEDEQTHLNHNESFDYEDEKVIFYEKVYRRSWYDAIELLENKEHEQIANYIDHYKRTSLHWACIKGASLNFINILIQEFPGATVMRDYVGRTPLHLACEFACDQIVFALLRATDARVTKMRDSQFMRSLLAEAIVHCRSPLIIDAILQADKHQIVLKDIHGFTPTTLFFRANLGRMLLHTIGAASNSTNVDDLIEIVSLLLQSEHDIMKDMVAESGGAGHIDDVLFHAIQSPSCPFAFVDYLLKETPGRGAFRNRNGDLPIHAVSRIREQNMIEYKCDECREAKMNELKYYFHRESMAQRRLLCERCLDVSEEWNYAEVAPAEKIKATTRILLMLNGKQAREVNSDGELPLVTTLKAGQSWLKGGVQELVDFYPAALAMKDEETDLFPFQLAATYRDDGLADNNKTEQELSTLNTTYELLLKWPMADRKL